MPDVDHASTTTASKGSVVGTNAPRLARTGVVRATALVATIGVLSAVVGIALLARTVHTPLQDCGTVYGFLRYGRTDVLADPANPPKGVSRAQVEATNAKPCRPRVAERARPSAALILGGTAAALAALLAEATTRGVDRRHRRQRAPLGAPPTNT